MKEDSNKLKEYLIDCFGVWKYVDPELVARVTPSSEWVEVPEDAELMFTNDCDQGFLPIFAKESFGVVYINWEGVWSKSKWEDVKELTSHFSNKVLWKRDKLQDSLDKYNATDHGEDFYKFDLLGNSIKPIKSDGGSSSYYFTTLPEHLIKDIAERGGIEIKDIVRYCFDNDADCKDIIKALKRIRENLKGGGKEGVDSIYDANKICFFAEELRSSLKECSKNV